MEKQLQKSRLFIFYKSTYPYRVPFRISRVWDIMCHSYLIGDYFLHRTKINFKNDSLLYKPYIVF
jgi:hypothetical protein